jgi:hypothetical protein
MRRETVRDNAVVGKRRAGVPAADDCALAIVMTGVPTVSGELEDNGSFGLGAVAASEAP